MILSRLLFTSGFEFGSTVTMFEYVFPFVFTVNSTLTVHQADNNFGPAQVFFNGTQTLGGSGSVLLSGGNLRPPAARASLRQS